MSAIDSGLTAELLKRLGKDLSRMRVLLVDRHSGARNSLRILLSALGITSVHGASSAAEVLRQVKANSFDIILADYQLEDGRDGQQLLEELRVQRLIPLATVYMLVTAERGYHNIASVAELTPDDYLIKPFTADQLQGRLARALYKKRYFARVFEQLDRGALAEALAACEAILGSEDAYYYDTLRCKGDILTALGRFEEARQVYADVLEDGQLPWARMGLAQALRGLGDLAGAEELAAAVIADLPEYLAAYDFVAGVREEMGELAGAQEALQRASVISPNNSLRQRMVGDVAVRNDDLDTAEKAYGKVLERHRGSSLRSVDDFTNLSRVMLGKGHVEGVRRVTREMRRELRGDAGGELAALVMDSLCAEREGEKTQAKQALDAALKLHQSLQEQGRSAALPQKIAVDLAHACLAAGEVAPAQEILARVAAENHDDRGLIAHIEAVYSATGNEEAGQALLARVGREIVELNSRGAIAARDGDAEASLATLIDAAERVPNLQFLLNAAKAILAVLDRKGWNEELAARAQHYLELAAAKDARNTQLIAARATYHQVARKYGVDAYAAVQKPAA